MNGTQFRYLTALLKEAGWDTTRKTRRWRHIGINGGNRNLERLTNQQAAEAIEGLKKLLETVEVK